MRPWPVQRFLAAAIVLCACFACTAPDKPTPTSRAGPIVNPASPNGPLLTASFGGVAWQPPAEKDIPTDSLGASIRRGLAILRHTTDSLPDFAPGHINCTNCHLQDGRSLNGAPLAGSYARYPKYIARSGAVVSMADRVNFCFTRSLAGSRLSSDSREMVDILAYLAWLSSGVPIGAKMPGSDGMPAMKDTLAGDVARGSATYAAKCQLCHQANGGGTEIVPALWGPRSFSVGASMARVERAATFIAHNMPLGMGGTLTPQEAFDVATFVNSHERPDLPGKENDWPLGGAPPDLPYTTTSGHQAVHAPPLLPRKMPARSIVPAPPRASALPQ
jgi:thiosulfate dehydrogenase